MARFTFALIAALLLTACTEDTPLTPIDEETDLTYGRDHDYRGRDLRVLTRNVYVGADVDVVLAAPDPMQVPALVAQAYQQLLATNFPERARALAREIRRTRPHLVGLQEVSTIRLQSPGDAIVGGTTPAEDVVFDYLEILMAALDARGEHYEVVARVQNPDVEIPMVTAVDENGVPTAFDDIRLTDYDVMLARKGVEISDVMENNYVAEIPIEALNTTIRRGYVAAIAKVGRQSYRFVNTHLESAFLPVRFAQASELIETFKDETLPVVLAGDLNTFAPTGDTYQLFLASNYQDAWTSRPRYGDGFTCCHASDLMNTEVNFDRRIDFIMARPATGQRLFAPDVRVIGKRLRERTRSGLWPSDHAGVWARLVMAKGKHK